MPDQKACREKQARYTPSGLLGSECQRCCDITRKDQKSIDKVGQQPQAEPTIREKKKKTELVNNILQPLLLTLALVSHVLLSLLYKLFIIDNYLSQIIYDTVLFPIWNKNKQNLKKAILRLLKERKKKVNLVCYQQSIVACSKTGYCSQTFQNTET